MARTNQVNVPSSSIIDRNQQNTTNQIADVSIPAETTINAVTDAQIPVSSTIADAQFSALASNPNLSSNSQIRYLQSQNPSSFKKFGGFNNQNQQINGFFNQNYGYNTQNPNILGSNGVLGSYGVGSHGVLGSNAVLGANEPQDSRLLILVRSHSPTRPRVINLLLGNTAFPISFEKNSFNDKDQKQSSTKNLSLEMNRISALPMPIIYHILSFLPAKEVVRTCVLTKGWINIWSSVPSFHFNSRLFRSSKTFIKFVDSLLFLRDGSDMQNVSLSPVGPFDDVHVRRIKKWITYAVRHNVQVLDFENGCERNIQLTPHLFTCESLREFKLFNNSLSLPLRIWLPSLKVMQLISVSLKYGKLDQAFFSASPSLETLILVNCNIKSGILTISASQLKNLNLKGNFPSSIVVSALNLISLKLNITNSVPVNIIFKGNLKLLSDANIDLKVDSSVSTTQLISIVKNVRYLTLSALFVQSIAVELQKDLATRKCSETPFSNLKWLKIGTLFSMDEVLLINHILMHSTEIESVFLVNDAGKFDGLKNIAQVEQYEVKYKLSHLKLVEIEGFRGSENEMELVNLFLENAIVLEKMIIFLCKSGECSSIDEQELVKVGRKLLTQPRASLTAGIMYWRI
ncbi:hypothetical protein IFM89_007942 [Coptis chinensis]|uniref:F-box domain-containing protein n=1 Tax=Coptis chinensis TaxID=261450 RepID=A0A835IKI6_9MAGN|nr:hypothetical protein IFM89_007942 [Coptis chinensis]